MGINEVTLLEIGILISISKSSKRVTSWNSHLNFLRYHFTLRPVSTISVEKSILSFIDLRLKRAVKIEASAKKKQ